MRWETRSYPAPHNARIIPGHSHGPRACIWCWVTGGTPEASYPPQPSLSALLTPGLMQISGHWSHSALKKCFPDLETASRCQQSGAKTMKSSVWQVLGEITNYCVWYGVFQLYPYPTSKKICYGGFTGCEKWVMWKNVTLYLSSVTCCCLHVILVSFKPQFE